MNKTATLLHHKEFILWVFFRNPVQVTGAAVPRALLQELQECPSGTAPWVRERTWKCFELNMSGSATWYLLTECNLIASDPPCSGKPSCTATSNWFVYYFKLLSSEGSWRNCTDVAVTTSTQEARSQEFCKCSQVLDFDLYFPQQRREYSVFLGSWEKTPAGEARGRLPPVPGGSEELSVLANPLLPRANSAQAALQAPLPSTAAGRAPDSRWHHPPGARSGTEKQPGEQSPSDPRRGKLGSPVCAWHARLRLGSNIVKL